MNMELRSGRYYSSKEGMELRSGLRMEAVEVPKPTVEEEYEGMVLRSGTQLPILKRQISFEDEEVSGESELTDRELKTIMLRFFNLNTSLGFEETQIHSRLLEMNRNEIIRSIKNYLETGDFTLDFERGKAESSAATE